nr:SpoIIIAH-like family protein [uncultured Blautia sp.]
MKKIVKKNQVIITSLAILIAVAGYLNFADVDLGIGDKEASTDSSSILDQVEYDLSDETAVTDENAETAAETAEVPDGSSTPGEAVLTGASDFAAQARLSREQIRSQNKADLQEILNNTEVGDDQKQEAVNTMVQMTEIAEKEAAAEMLLEAKGFENAVVNLTGETADVVVPQADLEDSKRAQIEDIIKRKTGIAPENIVITPLNESEEKTAAETDITMAEEENGTYEEQETSGEDIVTEGIYD